MLKEAHIENATTIRMWRSLNEMPADWRKAFELADCPQDDIDWIAFFPLQLLKDGMLPNFIDAAGEMVTWRSSYAPPSSKFNGRFYICQHS